MPADSAFLRNLLDSPADDTARLVYADWLDEQGDQTSRLKAEFIRFELEAANLPDETLRRAAVNDRLRKQAAALDPGWLAVVSHPALEECRLRFEFECPMKWEKLAATAEQKVRFCDSCRRNVHYCDTIEEAQDHAWRGDCVAVSLALVRRPGDLAPPVLGVIRLNPDQITRLGRIRAARPDTTEPRPGSVPASQPGEDQAPGSGGRNRARPSNRRDQRRRNRRRDRNTPVEESGDEG